MIHRDGRIEFEFPQLTLTPKTTLEDFRNSNLFSFFKPQNQNEPYARFSFEEIVLHDETFSGSICFCSGLIWELRFESMRPEFGNWNTNSAKQEQARHFFHKQLLEKIFLSRGNSLHPEGWSSADVPVEYKFSWGLVCAVRDCKTDNSSILILFGENAEAMTHFPLSKPLD